MSTATAPAPGTNAYTPAAGTNAATPPGVNPSSLLGGAGGPSSGLTGGNQAIAPGAATSPYELQLVEGAQVIIGPWLAQMLKIPSMGRTPVSGATVLQAYDDLPRASQTAVMSFLYKAGYYINAEGVKPSQFDFNASDANNQNAMVNAILQTYNKNLNASPGGTSMSSLTASLIYSGAGQQELQTAPSPVLGGGNTYQVTLTSPADLYNTLYSTWESELGYAPDQQTLNKYVGTFQGEQAKYQQALNAQQEQGSYRKFLQQETARNTELGYANTPQVAGGAVPSGPFHTPAAWATAFVQYLNQAEGVPMTASNVAYILGIMNKLGGWGNATSSFNPLGVQTPAPGPGQVITGNPNPNAPAKYSSWAQGMQSSLDELAKYPGMLALLLTGDASSPKQQAAGSIPGEVAQWTNGKVKTVIKPTPGETAAANHASAVAIRTAVKVKPAAPLTSPGAIAASAGQSTGPSAGGGGQSPAQANAIAQATLGQGPSHSPGARGPGQGEGQTLSGAVGQAQIDLAKKTSPDYTGHQFGPPAAGFPGSPGTPAALPVSQEPTIAEAQAKAKQILAQARGGRLPTPDIPTTPAADLTSGQNQYSTGDTYLGASTLVGTQPPSAQGLAFTEATTGANAVPFQGNEYLNAFETIANMISQGKAA